MKRTITILICCIILLRLMVTTIPKANATSFTDVTQSSMDIEMFEAIMYVSDNGLMIGTSSTSFSPTTILTRAQIVTILYRIAGSPTASYSIPFTDVPNGTFYHDAVCWAYHYNITNGTTATTFSPNDQLTTQESITFLYRYACLDHSFTVDPTLINSYSDYSSISPFARTAMNWATQYCILQRGYFNMAYPTLSVSRAKEALFICRYEKNLIGFFDGNKKYKWPNNSASNSMMASVKNRLYGIVDSNFSTTTATNIKSIICQEIEQSSAKCTGISFANYLDATGRHDFNRAVEPLSENMYQLSNFLINGNVLSGINFYQVGNAAVCMYRTKANTASLANQFYEDVSAHGPTIIAYYWYAGTEHHGHCVICTAVRKISSSQYELSVCDPNYTWERHLTLTYLGDSVTFDSHTISSFEYYSYEAMKTIAYLDIDGTYNTLRVN